MDVQTKFPRVLKAAKLVRMCEKKGDDHLLDVAMAAFDREVEAAMWVKREVRPAEQTVITNPRELLDALEIDNLTPDPPKAPERAIPDLEITDDEQEPTDDDAGEPDSVILARAGVQHVHATD